MPDRDPDTPEPDGAGLSRTGGGCLTAMPSPVGVRRLRDRQRQEAARRGRLRRWLWRASEAPIRMMRPVHGREPAGYRGPTVVLTPAACTAAGAHNGCLRRPIITQEQQRLMIRDGRASGNDVLVLAGPPQVTRVGFAAALLFWHGFED